MKNRSIKILYFFLLLFVGCNFPAAAQDQPDLRDRAERYFKEFQYAKAATIYLRLVDMPHPYLHDMENLAICYAKMNRYEDAEIWYARVVQHPKSQPSNWISYGRVLKTNAHYAKAKEALQTFVRKTKKPELVANDIAGCDSAIKWMATPVKIQVKNESGVNTSRAEFFVLPVSDSLVYFMGEPEVTDKKVGQYGRTGNSYLRIFSAKKSPTDSLVFPGLAPVDMNKTPYHVGPVGTNKTEDVYFITRTYSGKNVKKTMYDGRTYLDYNMELFIQPRVYGVWKDPVPFVYNNVKKYSVGHAALSADEKVLYFVSDMPGGEGGTDIWYCELQKDGSWGKCKNAGKKINTSGNEMFPFVAANGVLYFSSDGWPGMGGMDIFSSHGEKDSWNKPLNLHFPVNSPGDDFAYRIEASALSGYFSSNRDNGKGNDDIYSFHFQKPSQPAILVGTASDKKSVAALSDVSVTLFDANNNMVAQQTTDTAGNFVFELDKPGFYHLQGTKFSYYPDTLTLERPLNTKDTLRASLRLDPLFEKGKVFRLKNILYDFDKADIRQDAEMILNELVEIMHENPTLEIEIGSHTDSRGTAEYNLDLSQRRAQSVVDYLVSKGISRTRMIAKGYGESKLLNRCSDGVDCSEEEHQQNRRTEFMVLNY